MLPKRPIYGPIKRYGPFVMNTKSEIQEVFFDFNRIGFYGWKWPNSDSIHVKYKERFAK